MNFQEASEIARRNPGSILTRDEFGQFHVRDQDGGLLGTSDETFSLTQSLRERDSKITQLEMELADLRKNIDAEVDSRLKPRILSVAAEWANVNELKLKLYEKHKKAESKLRRLQLLEDAYAKRFGAAEVKEIKESIQSREVCSRCGGDGGVNGGCGKCDGTGWAINEIETIREEVRVK